VSATKKKSFITLTPYLEPCLTERKQAVKKLAHTQNSDHDSLQ
jgi:hypothetical protein